MPNQYQQPKDHLALSTSGAPCGDEAVEFPRRASSHSGTCSGWSVEARTTMPMPFVVSDIHLTLTEHWRQLPISPGEGGVPGGPRFMDKGRDFGLVSYPAAQALRWWFIAEAHAHHCAYKVETRLVRHEIEYSESATPVAAVDVVQGDDEGQA